MSKARCPFCSQITRLKPSDIGQEVVCPHCARSFLGALPAQEEPVEEDEFVEEEESNLVEKPRPVEIDDAECLRIAERQLLLPMLATLCISTLAILAYSFNVIQISVNPKSLKGDPFVPVLLQDTPQIYIILQFVSILKELLISAAAICGLRLENRKFVAVGMVVQSTACCSGCICLNLPLGIWSLIILNRPLVKRGFRLSAER